MWLLSFKYRSILQSDWFVLADVNGLVNYSRGSTSGTMQADHPKRQRNYRLIVDPALKQGPTKLYSIEGHIPGVRIDVAMLT